MPQLPIASHNAPAQLSARPKRQGQFGTAVLQWPRKPVPRSWQLQKSEVYPAYPPKPQFANAQPTPLYPNGSGQASLGELPLTSTTAPISRRPPAPPANAWMPATPLTTRTTPPKLEQMVLRRNAAGQQVDAPGQPVPVEFRRGPFRPGVDKVQIERLSQPSTGVPGAALQGLQQVNAYARAGMAPPDPKGGFLPSTERDTAAAVAAGAAMGPRGPYDQLGWQRQSRLLHEKLAGEGRQILDQRAASNDALRRQSAARGLLPGTEFELDSKGRRWVTRGANAARGPVTPDLPAGAVDTGMRTAPAVVGGQGHRVLRPDAATAARDQELLASIRYRDAERARAREELAGMGGYREPRTSGLGGLIDRVLPPKQVTPGDFSRPGFGDDVLRAEAAKAKRARYLAGEGEYKGRGAADREAVLADRREQVIANAALDRADRRWRMNGGPQQQAWNNFLAMRNPGFAAESVRANTMMQIAALDRDIRREEIAMQRDESRGRLDESRAARLDAMKLARSQMDMEGRKLDQSGELGRAGLDVQKRGIDAQMEQDRQQHAEAMGALGARNMPNATEREQIIQSRMAGGMRRDEATASVDAEYGRVGAAPAGAGATSPGGGAGDTAAPIAQNDRGKITAGAVLRAGRIPPDLRAYAGKPDEFIAAARSSGYSDAAIKVMLRMLSPGVRGVSIRRPKGPGFFSHLNPFQSGEDQWQALSDWWRNLMD